MKRPPKLPPIRVWREHLDDQADVVCAFCFRVGRRQGVPFLYGVSQFTIIKKRLSWSRVREYAEDRLRQSLRIENRLPLIGPCEDQPGWGDFDD